MDQIKTDLHVHSIFTDHAYSTIDENARFASKQGIELIAITDHFGPMFIHNVNSAMFHFNNRIVLPDELYGVRVLRGIEIDIVDHKGTLAFSDLVHPYREGEMITDYILNKCEFVIASVHQNSDLRPATVAEHTQMYCNALMNPYVDMIGHSGRSGMPYELDEVLKLAKDQGKIIEINNHSFMLGDSNEKCTQIAERCAELGVYIAVNSDAHFAYDIGQYDAARKMLEEIHFPKELIANQSRAKIESVLKARKDRITTC